MIRKKNTRGAAAPARARKRRTLAEVERLAAKGIRRAKDELREFAEHSKRAAETTVSQGVRVVADVRRSLGEMSIPEIIEMMRKKRPVGAPRKESTANMIELLAKCEVERTHYRPLARMYCPDLSPADAYDRLRSFRNKHVAEIKARVEYLKSAHVKK